MLAADTDVARRKTGTHGGAAKTKGGNGSVRGRRVGGADAKAPVRTPKTRRKARKKAAKRPRKHTINAVSPIERACRELIPGYDPWATAGDAWFDIKAAERACGFFPTMLTHVEGALAGQPFILEPWQQAVVGNLFGWKRIDEKGRTVRRYRKALLFVARKNGKTPLAAGLCLYALFCDGEAGAQIYSAAAEREQAALLYRHASGMVRAEEYLHSRGQIYKATKAIVLRAEPASAYKVISADAYSKHGFNPHLVVVDELHAQPNRELVDTIESAFVSLNRPQPLLLYVTTSDWERESVCNEEHDYAVKVRDGAISAPSYLPVIFEVPRGTDWHDESLWPLANPNLGVSVSLQALRDEHSKAVETPSKENTFRRLHLNQRTEQDIRWLALEKWSACRVKYAADDLAGRPCYAGLDLSANQDLTACVLAFPWEGGRARILPTFWIPAEAVEEREKRDKVPYSAWIRQGLVRATPGPAIDYDFVRNDLLELAGKYKITELGYDPWNAAQIIPRLVNDGFECVEVRQGYRSMSPPTKEVERMVLLRTLEHDGNPVMAWNFANVAVETDPAGNVKPSKSRATGRIDGIVALIIAVSRMVAGAKPPSVYETRGPILL